MIKTTTKNSGEVLYDAPSVNVLDVQSEGLLCASFGEAGEAGKILNEENDEWNF